MTTRKIISLLVVLALCCSLIPAAAASTVSVPEEITDYINAGHDEITLWISLDHPTDAEMEALYKEEIPDGLDAAAYNDKRLEILRRVYSPITEDFIRTQLDGCTIIYRSIYTNTIVATVPSSLVPALAKNEAVLDLTLDYLIDADLEPADPNDVTKLQEDFIVRLAELGWSVASLKAEDILVTDYGTYSSGKVVLAYSRWMLQTTDIGKLTVGPYTFKFPSGSLPQFFLLYHDGAFTPVAEAYENGLLSPAELATLAAVYYGEEPCTHDYEAVVTEPTCEQPGSTTYTCSKCGNSYTADEVAATGHKYDKVVTEPDCVNGGYTTYICSVCGDSYKADETAALGHKYDKVVTEPDCVNGGYTTYTCSVCGDSYKADETAALGHKYDKVVTEPDCVNGGYTTYTCSVCGDSYKADETAALGHKYDKVVTEADCVNGGYTTYTCSVCGDSYKADEVAATGHKWDNGKVTKEPTEEAEGVRTFTCTVCGETRTESIPKLPEGHKHDYKAVVTAPTCETAGYTTYTCECGNSYKADEVAALGHDFKDVTVDPTCTEAGSVTKTCSRCDYEETVVLPALGHNFVDSVCANCGEQENAEHICPSEKFPDVPAFGTWAHEGIDYCVENELMKGTDKGLFNPKGTLTRAELVTILYRVEGSPEVELKGVFTDVPANAWFAVAVEWAAANKIVEGYGDGSFGTNDPVTREQLVTLFWRYQGRLAVEADALATFGDAQSVSPWAEDAFAWAVSNGLIQGKPGKILDPTGTTSRAQLATILMRMRESN